VYTVYSSENPFKCSATIRPANDPSLFCGNHPDLLSLATLSEYTKTSVGDSKEANGHTARFCLILLFKSIMLNWEDAWIISISFVCNLVSENIAPTATSECETLESSLGDENADRRRFVLR